MKEVMKETFFVTCPGICAGVPQIAEMLPPPSPPGWYAWIAPLTVDAISRPFG